MKESLWGFVERNKTLAIRVDSTEGVHAQNVNNALKDVNIFSKCNIQILK